MRDRPCMPQLSDDATTGCVNCIGDAPPPTNLFLTPQARRIRPTKSFGADRRGLGDNQSRRGALRIILCLQGRGHMIMRLRTHPGERRHDDAVRKIEVSHPIWCEKGLIPHQMNSCMGEAFSTRVLFWSVVIDLSLARFN